MCLGDFTFFSPRLRLRKRRGFGSPGSFDPLRGGAARGQLSILQRTFAVDVVVSAFRSPRGSFRLSRHALGVRGGGFSLSLGLQLGFSQFFGGAMPYLRPVLPAGRGKVTVLGPMQVRPGVQYRHIFPASLRVARRSVRSTVCP